MSGILRIAATGFVSASSGSVASANALLLRELLAAGVQIHFFSKASFVDPREAAETHPGFHFTDVDNRFADRLRNATARVPLISTATRFADVATYNHQVVRAIQEAHARERFDLCLWFGDYARGHVEGIPTVSFAQGPPGTDARSIIRHFSTIRALAGPLAAWKWRILATLRLSRAGLPVFRHSDHIIVGSKQSRQTLHECFGVSDDRTSSLPYPIDLATFSPGLFREPERRCLWLGRIVPRKRLDVFLDGLAAAIRSGLPLTGTVVGALGFIPGYEKLLREFAFPNQLEWIPSVPRAQVPDLLRAHDILIQPSEEEDFGSSVAEAQACGLPVIVGSTNGNADYLSTNDIRLTSDTPAALSDALSIICSDPTTSRAAAERFFSPSTVAAQLVAILERVLRRNR